MKRFLILAAISLAVPLAVAADKEPIVKQVALAPIRGIKRYVKSVLHEVAVCLDHMMVKR